MNAPTVTTLDNTSFDTLLECACAEFDRIGRELNEFADGYAEAIREVQQAHRKRAADLRLRYDAAKITLMRMVSGNRHQFDKPRTRSMLGVEVGLRLLPERVEFEFDDALTLELIDTTLAPEVAALVAPISRDIMLAPVKKLTDKQRHDIGARLVSGEVIVAKHAADVALKALQELAQ